MSKDQTQLTNNERRAISWHVQRRMVFKLLAIVIVILAYLGLRALETATNSYESERGRPIVLVGKEVVSQNKNSKTYSAVLVPMSDALNLIPVPEEKTRDLISSGPNENEAVRKKLSRLENHYFPDEQAIIAQLDQDIRAEAYWGKRSLLLTEDAENRNRASKLPNISRDEALIHDALRSNGFRYNDLKDVRPEKIDDRLDDLIKEEWGNLSSDKRDASDKQIQKWQKRFTLTLGISKLQVNDLIILHEKIVSQADYEVRFKRLKKDTAKIEDNAQKQINLVYEKLKPALGELIKRSPGAPKLPAENAFRGWFNPRSLLDARSSTHVIYQTVQLTLSMVLILGVIFLLVLILRFLPFFAGSTDQLRDQTKAFLQRSGGTVPPVAKSIIATASALAIGTAVVVAGNKAITPPTRDPIYDGGSDNGDANNQLPGNQGPGRRKPPQKPSGECNDCGEYPPDDRVDVHVVKLEEPIAYPSPITISGADSLTLTEQSIDRIKTAITASLKSTTTTISDADLEVRIRKITEQVFTEKVTTITSTCCKTGGDSTFKPEPFLQLLQPTFTTIESIRKDLDATRKKVEEIQNQNDNLQPQTDSGGRGVVTRTKQFFKGDRYLVTRQTVESLRILMTKLPIECEPGVPGKKCCGNEQVNDPVCKDSKVDAILGRLAKMIGYPPASESDFMQLLRGSTRRDDVDKTIDKWKSVILRYARVPY